MPSWAPFLYSQSKGTGKSTLCNLIAGLFGLENTATQNNVDQLTGRFSSTLLLSKLVICEETYLRPGSSQGNTLKMNITGVLMLDARKAFHIAKRKQETNVYHNGQADDSWARLEVAEGVMF